MKISTKHVHKTKKKTNVKQTTRHKPKKRGFWANGYDFTGSPGPYPDLNSAIAAVVASREAQAGEACAMENLSGPTTVSPGVLLWGFLVGYGSGSQHGDSWGNVTER